MSALFTWFPFVLMAYGVVAVLWSTRYAMAARRFRDPQRALLVVRGIRVALAGIAAFGVGVGWWLDFEALIGLALVFFGQEMLEATVVITALRAQVRRRGTALPG